MKETELAITVIASLMAGMLMAFGIVLMFVFFGSSDTICRSALYSFLSIIV